MKRLLHQIKMKYLGEQDNNIIALDGQRKYEKSGLTREQALKIRVMITKAFDEDKIYRNNDMGLDDLAEHIKHNRYKVSQVINTYFSKNFYSFLSEYRIKEAKRLLASNPNLSVKAIMYEVGFNSKNSFYTAFKKSTGISPNGYRNASFKHGMHMA
ncbi:Helix-turn-helix domain-containing protein [Flagellimonas taeanensis]|uniref:Helix-turn-helix domain-containing protein n=1 Tax=Flagellimonas taeanensis TaxID=1005926 RepID=A0A1M6P5T7_9FLAO|nr:helix-turn-helix domain-containing protein [Allomuricauda taeanensis]SFB66349.1 Helix-turn-helix domain-containing protein [Allomuricauda taeanensis]SHK03295.1 Helix-turn-helix domain-containing protein [Allomuricauda taeanensis]